jgi:hypothetical protein
MGASIMNLGLAFRFIKRYLVCTGLALGAILSSVAAIEPADNESYKIKDLDGHFPFVVPETLEAWHTRSRELREQLEVALGLFPRPTLAPLQPVIHSTQIKDGYIIEDVYFESLPGLFVTGNLYRPLVDDAAASIRRPAVLCPHGHWSNGRFYFTSDDEARKELATGAERFEAAAHSPLQARCVQMARMGIIVFHYDMLGYADSQQIDMKRAHGFGLHGPNPDVGPDRWLLYSPKAEGMCQNTMGIQTIQTLQSLEFLLQRSDVDPSRVSITGASGGGTQTFIASAIEPRFAGAYPVVMVSTSMQGGCTCENASGLRVDTGNVEIAALTAPRPLGVNAANDWTRDMARDGFPELKRLYSLYNAEDRVNLHVATHFPHNYNHVTRVPMYGFMNQLFGLGLQEPILEADFDVMKGEQLSVWDSDHPEPPGGLKMEAELLKRWGDDAAAKIEASPELRSQGWKTILRPAERIAATLRVVPSSKSDQRWKIINDDGTEVGSIRAGSDSQAVDTIEVVAVQNTDGEPAESASDAVNLLAIGDAWGIDSGASVQSLVTNPRPAPCYTYGYNPPLFLRRLAVLLAVIDSQEIEIQKWEWVGRGPHAGLVAAAAVMRPQRLRAIALDPQGFDFDRIESLRDPNFLPGAIRFGGISGLQSVYSNEKR